MYGRGCGSSLTPKGIPPFSSLSTPQSWAWTWACFRFAESKGNLPFSSLSVSVVRKGGAHPSPLVVDVGVDVGAGVEVDMGMDVAAGVEVGAMGVGRDVGVTTMR